VVVIVVDVLLVLGAVMVEAVAEMEVTNID
jgi:hypothetical protein